MFTKLIVAVATIASPSVMVNYEIDRLNDNYERTLKQCVKEQKPIVVWINLDDPFEDYSKINNVKHVFVKTFPGITKGVVVGIPNGESVYRYNIIQGPYASKINNLINPPRTLINPVQVPCLPGRA